MAQQFDVMQSLFGFAPADVQRQIGAEQQQTAMGLASGVPGEYGAAAFQAFRGLEQARGTPLFASQEDPRLQQAKVMQEARQAAQPAFEQGGLVGYLNQYANELEKRGLADKAIQARSVAAQKEQEAMKTQADVTFKQAQAQKMMTPTPQRPIQVDLGDRIQLRDPATNEVIEEIRKGVTPAQRERMAEQQAQEEPGFIGKTGAYRNKFGEVIPATEMAKQRQGFVQAQDLLAKLNKIDYDTVKKAQSPFDYTEPGVTKTIGSQVASSTVNAQTTIAATQLLEQINKLPPGSASDADMRAAVRDFPGYGNAENLANWVNRTKETLADSLARQNELYGFPVQVKPTPRIGPKKKEQDTQTTGEWRIVP